MGPGGELASYAFGRTSGSDPHVAHLSIGIGAGNPAGGTFHAILVPHEESYAYSLTDMPFERVPQGGPDPTAEQARAHEDLPFVRWVTDHVMQHDRRAEDPSLIDVLDLPPGRSAARTDIGKPWTGRL